MLIKFTTGDKLSVASIGQNSDLGWKGKQGMANWEANATVLVVAGENVETGDLVRK